MEFHTPLTPIASTREGGVCGGRREGREERREGREGERSKGGGKELREGEREKGWRREKGGG